MLVAAVFIAMLCSVHSLPIQEGKEGGAHLMRKRRAAKEQSDLVTMIEKNVAAIENGLHLMRSSRQSANVPTEDVDAIASMEIDGHGKLTHAEAVEVSDSRLEQHSIRAATQQQSTGSLVQTSGSISPDVDNILQLPLSKQLMHAAKSFHFQTSSQLSLGLILVSMLACTVVTIEGFRKAAMAMFEVKGCRHDGAEVYEEQGVTLSHCKKCGQRQMFLASLNTWVPYGQPVSADDDK
jgi:hypothetical protein